MLERYKVVRRLALLWVLALITYATIRVFGYGMDKTEEYIALVGLLAIAIGFYTTWRGKRESQDNDYSGPPTG